MPFNSGALIMAEGAPEFHEQRGIFVLTVPVGSGCLRIGFLSSDFLQGCRDGQATWDAFCNQNKVEYLRLFANGGHAASSA